MSVVLKLKNDNNAKRVYLIYDFKQIKDSIMLIMYLDNRECWKKFFINYKDGEWKTEILKPYTDEETYKQICNKLKYIFTEQEHINDINNLDFEEVMQENAEFILGINA